MKGLLACGDVYFSRIKTDGSYEGFIPVGIASKLGIKASSQLKEQISKSCNSYGQVAESVAIPAPSEVSISLGTLNKQNLAIQFLGTQASNDTVGGTLTAVPLVFNDLDAIVRAPQGGLTNVVIKNTGGATTYTAGTDYEVVNASAGLIKPITGGAITAGETVELTADYSARTSTKILGGTESQIKVGVMLIGKNLVDGKGLTVDIWKTTLAPTGEVDFLSDDFVKLELSGKAELVDGKASAFEAVVDIV